MYKTISYVVPIFNEESNIDNIIIEIISAFEENDLEKFEIIFIDDGSYDNSVENIRNYINKGLEIKCICLTRNFGHQQALTAGLKYTKHDLIAILDGDLQDPPKVINKFINKINEGFDVIYGVRTKRKEIFYKKIAYSLFYKILYFFSNIRIPLDSGDFCLMNKNALDKINQIPESNRFVRGLRSYIGLNQTGIKYEREARREGQSKYNFRKLLKLASDGIYNFSDKPLKITSAIGFMFSFLSLVSVFLLLYQRIFSINVFGYSPADVPGYTSIIISIFFVAGIQLFAIGIIGEYVSRIFLESKRRPSYFIREIIE